MASIQQLTELLKRAGKTAKKADHFVEKVADKVEPIVEAGHRTNAVNTTAGLVAGAGDHGQGHNLLDLGFEYANRAADSASLAKAGLKGASAIAPAVAKPVMQAATAGVGAAATGLGKAMPWVYRAQLAAQTADIARNPEKMDAAMEDSTNTSAGGRLLQGLANPPLQIAAAGKGLMDTVGSYLGAAATDAKSEQMAEKLRRGQTMLAAKSLDEVSSPIPAPMYGGGGRTQPDMRKKSLLADHDAALTALDGVTSKTAPGIDPAEVELRRKALLASRSEAENWKDGPKLNTRAMVAQN